MITIHKTLKSGIVLACVMMMPQATIAGSETTSETNVIQAAFIEDVGSTERINFSGKLRMLSQRIPAAACHFAAGVDADSARSVLGGAKSEFAKILNALEFGDAELNIKGQEQDRKTLAQIHDLRAKWEPFAATVDQILDGNANNENVLSVMNDSMGVLGSAKLLVSEVTAQYSNPAEMTLDAAMVIDIAGRQRMLTQKMSKESCAVWSGLSPDAASDLTSTMQTFDASLNALIHGMPAAGIKAPPTMAITAGLGVVNKDWEGVKDTLTSVAAGGMPSGPDAASLFQQLNTTLVNMNKVVVLYTATEKQTL